MTARRRQDPLDGAVRAVLESLMSDDTFVAHIAETEIERRIQAGVLVESESLRAGPFELVPAGRVRRLEQVAAAVLAEDVNLEEVRAAASELVVVDDEGELVSTASTDTPAGPGNDDVDEPDPDVEQDEEAEEVEDELEARRRPRSIPGPDDDLSCTECGTDVPLELAQVTAVRHRAVYCDDCLDKHLGPRETAEAS